MTDLSTEYLGLKLRTPLVHPPVLSVKMSTTFAAWLMPALRQSCFNPCSKNRSTPSSPNSIALVGNRDLRSAVSCCTVSRLEPQDPYLPHGEVRIAA